ncbi:MAG: phosphate acyltransferase PlsX [Candidatus Marinimicrobia bacterium]|nr:phosphate acyltransferase PlsX [Candidatus Neomarinimicrobiota bacterium]
MNPITVVVDAMGGDNAPKAIIRGAVKAAKDHPVKIILVGEEESIKQELDRLSYPDGSIIIHPTTQQIEMGESPQSAIEEKTDSSIVQAAQILAAGKAEALISAGSTGSVVLAAAKHIPRIYGVRRTAIATVYPTLNELKRKDYLALMLDVGANIHSSAEELVQFALMGAAYVSSIRGVEEPTVALLNIGEEETKGGEKMKLAYQILKKTRNLKFHGNIEGKDIMRGVVDVIVTEGFVGNTVIKTLEGAANTMSHLGKIAFKTKLSWKIGLIMLRKGLQALKEVTDYSEYGGAPLLGFERMVIIAHGRSNPKAIANAIKVASKCVRDDLSGHISSSIKDYEVETAREFYQMVRESD